jgi:hypothetical protein
MKRRLTLVAVPLVLAAGVLAVTNLPSGASGSRNLQADLTGYEEVPAISTLADGTFRARFNDDQTISWTLSYEGLQAPSTQAHIHFGAPRTAGGVTVWLCSNLASPPTPAGVKPCATTTGTVSGTITAASVVGPAGQGIAAGELGELVRALRSGLAYANVHSTQFPSGEIRGQIMGGDGGHGHEVGGAADG